MKGVIRYDENGKPICEICGKSFHRVLAHVWQVHDMTEREYKLMFGLDLGKGICSQESYERSRDAVLENWEVSVEKNLLEGGENSRFEEGSEGRTKDQVSEQTRKMLKERLETPEMKEAMRKVGRELGLSGKGNKVRWKKEEDSNNQSKS